MALGFKGPPLVLIEGNNPRISKQAHTLSSHLPEGIEQIHHQMLAKTNPLIEGMNGHVPDGGFKHSIACAAGKSHQTRQAGVMAPQANLDEAVVQGLAHTPDRPTPPAHRLKQLFQLDKIKGPGLAEHQYELFIRAWTLP